MPPFPSELTYYSLLQYSPRAQNEESAKSRDVLSGIKNDGSLGSTRVIALAAKRARETLPVYPFLKTCLGSHVALVPMPRSTLQKSGALWPAHRICQALLQEGLGREILPCLRRSKPVQKAALAAPGQRPEPEDHYNSISVSVDLIQRPTEITVIDDVITRGSSFVGIFPHLKQTFPGVPIHFFG